MVYAEMGTFTFVCGPYLWVDNVFMTEKIFGTLFMCPYYCLHNYQMIHSQITKFTALISSLSVICIA